MQFGVQTFKQETLDVQREEERGWQKTTTKDFESQCKTGTKSARRKEKKDISEKSKKFEKEKQRRKYRKMKQKLKKKLFSNIPKETLGSRVRNTIQKKFETEIKRRTERRKLKEMAMEKEMNSQGTKVEEFDSVQQKLKPKSDRKRRGTEWWEKRSQTGQR